MGILLDLAQYDGKQVDVLEAIQRSHAPDAGVLAELITLADAEETNVATGATWLLRSYVEAGAPLDSNLVSSLAVTLKGIGSHWARLHICQAVRSIEIPEGDAGSFADFLHHCTRSERPFLRAWATDGLYRLAQQHDSYEAEAALVLETALTDPAASVRARARRILLEK